MDDLLLHHGLPTVVIIAAIAVLVVVERRAREAVMPPHLFRDRNFLLATASGLLIGELLVLIVQNSFPASEVGAATAANNYFRQIGASLGSTVVGTVFTHRLTGVLGSSAEGS